MANFQDSTVPDLTITGLLNGGNVLAGDPPAALASKNDGGNAYSTLGYVPFNDIKFTSGGMTVTNNGSRFNIPEDGKYLVFMTSIGNNTGIISEIQIGINGANTSTRLYARSAEHSYPNCVSVTIFDFLVAGDYVGADVLSGDWYFSSSIYTSFGVIKISD